ncbi:MAG: excisionase family DNA-binding protein [Chloroflexi bacterium]|nr:excisionase family DNA-binding protein [Chloroflexota bacterium]
MARLTDRNGFHRAIAPTEEEKRLALETSRHLDRLKLDTLSPPRCDIRVRVLDEDGVIGTQPFADPGDEEPSGFALSIPLSAFRLLSEILKEMAKGNAVTVLPVRALLSTQQAANLLNVSRPFLVGLLESGKIPHQKLGTHRRVLFQDLMAFKKKADIASDRALRAIQEEAQELDLGY